MPGDDDILRIAAQFDVGSITAGVEQAAAAVKTGTAKMNDSFTNLAAAQIRVASANKELRDTLSGTVSKGLTPTAAATQEVAAAMFEAKIATEAFKAAQEEAYGATQKFGSGVNNVRVGFTGLTQDIGVRGSRVLGSFIAQSASLAPILQAAFPVIAAIAFFEILEAGYHKLIDVTSALAGWNKEAKAMYAELVQLNQQQVSFNEKLSIEKLQLNEVGLKGATLDAQKQIDLLQEKRLIQEAYVKSVEREKNIRFEMSHEEKETIKLSDPATGMETGEAEISRTITPDKDRLAELNKELTAAMSKTQSLQQELMTLDQVRTPKASKETIAKQIEEAQKYTEALAKMADEDSALTQRNAEKELRELEKLANERERLEEEMEKTTFDMAKKDLDTFEHSLVQKTRFQEEAGKNELEQVRAASEAKSRAVEANSRFGGADPRLITIADKALDDQSLKIMDLIALEEELRAKLLQTGMAESDPKIVESLSRQEQLVQQLAVAMQKYDQVVQKVGQSQLKQFQKNFESVTASVNRGIMSWVDGTEKFGQAMLHVWTGIVNSAIQGMLQIGEKWLMTHLEMAIIGKATGTASAASQIGAAAGETFANAYAAISAIPIVGPAMAPGIAAASASSALAGGMAFLAFEQGGIMGGSEGLALLHPREMVLPSHISQSVQQMAAGGSTSGRSSTGQIHAHFHISGSPSSSDKSAIEKNLVAVVKRARRRGSF